MHADFPHAVTLPSAHLKSAHWLPILWQELTTEFLSAAATGCGITPATKRHVAPRTDNTIRCIATSLFSQPNYLTSAGGHLADVIGITDKSICGQSRRPSSINLGRPPIAARARYEKVERVVESSPFRFTRADIARRLDAARPDADGFHGARIVLDAPSMPSIGLSVERLAGGTTRPYRTTANQIFLAMAGAGDTVIGSARFSWKPGDTLAAPSWCTISHQATSDAELFAMSDEPLLRFSKYYRFEGAS